MLATITEDGYATEDTTGSKRDDCAGHIEGISTDYADRIEERTEDTTDTEEE